MTQIAQRASASSGSIYFKKALGVIAAAIVVLYLGFLILLFVSQRSILYPGVNRVAGLPPRAPGLEVLKIPTVAGDVEALFLPATKPATANATANVDAANAKDSRQPVMIFGHGNGEVTDDWVSAFEGFRDRGIGVFLVEYPGYGRSTGSPSEQALRAAMDAAYDRIAADPRIDRTRILGFGQSLGGGAICLLAKDRPLRALILQSTFPSLDIFAARYGAPAFLLKDHFDNISTVANFPGPILVIHGRHDELIPWPQGQRLATTSADATFRLYDCGHGCWDPDRLPFWQDADPFLVKAGMITRAR
jgi:pimeloyl-ACP methyl ester carboxylesterase